MAEQLKLMYNKTLINTLAQEIKKTYIDFNIVQFEEDIFCHTWENKELKDRMHHIAVILNKFLPNNYVKSLNILKQVAPKFDGFEYMFFQDYVELFGLDFYEESINALELFTQYASSEFAIRAFIIKYEDKTMEQMLKWANSNNHHLRRLASEGCRPRLPWAVALANFKNDPSKVLEILEILKDDESLYVRKSVANNLNDISKDNAQVAIKVFNRWKNRNKNCDWIIKHGARTLLKAGNIEVLNIFGFGDVSHIKLNDFTLCNEVEIGSLLPFSFNLSTHNKAIGNTRIEYAIHFLKSNNKLSKKVFMISSSNIEKNCKKIAKNHSFKKISTRRYYKGVHALSIIINGIEVEYKEFILN